MPKIGYVSLYRSLLDHPIWLEKPFSKGQAWADIILMVNYVNEKVMSGNEIITVKRGSMITTEKFLTERWGWSKSKVRSFLELLQSDKMIVKKTDRKKTTISVVKYGVYQKSQTTKEPQKDREKTAKRPQKDRLPYIKNKKINKEINNISSTTRACARPTQEEVETFVREKGLTIDPTKFFFYYEEHGWGFDWRRRAEEWNRREYRQKKNPDQSGIAAYDMKAFEQMLADDDGEDDEES